MPISAWRPKSLMDWVALVFLLWIGSHLYLYVFTIGGPKPLYSYLLLLGLSGTYLAFTIIEHRHFSRRLSGFLLWIALYLAYGAFEFVRSSQEQESIQALITLGEAVLLSGAFAMIMCDERRVQLAAAALALLALVGSAVNIVDFYFPVFTVVPGRAAGLYGNPTLAGSMVALAMVAGSFQIPREWRLWYIIFCGLGVAVTFSRGSWVLWGAAVPGLAWAGILAGQRVRWWSALAIVLVGMGLVASLYLGQLGRAVATSGLGAYLTPDTEARLGIGASLLSGEAARQRLYVAQYSVDLATEAPLLGHGLGFTQTWDYFQGPHNMYLLFLVEGGAIGFVLYLALLAVLWRASRGIGRVLTIQLALSSFFSHNHLEQPAILLIMAFIVVHGAAQQLAQAPASSAGHLSLQPR